MRTVTQAQAYKYGRESFTHGPNEVNCFADIFISDEKNMFEWRCGFFDAKNDASKKPGGKISTRTQLKAELKSIFNRCIGTLSLNDIVTSIGEHLSDDIAVEMWTQEEGYR